MPNVHPLVVHFPIALIFVIVACDLIGLLFHNRTFILTGTILSVFAALGAAVTAISGLLAADDVWHLPASSEMLETHETLGLVFLGIIVVMLILRFALKDRIYGKLGWIVFVWGVIGAGVVTGGGYLGGEMVYRYGTGVKEAQMAVARADSLAKLLNISPLEQAPPTTEKQ